MLRQCARDWDALDLPIACLADAAAQFGYGSHASCCSLAEATRGHHCISRFVFDQVKTCDAAAELESEGLIPGTALRPADILTFALGHGGTALDVGFVSPHAIGSHGQCIERMRRRKLDYYELQQQALAAQNVVYQPLIWSCYGEPHPATTRTLFE